MCIIEDLLQVSHSKDAENYYHSVEDAKYKGIDIGRKEGISIGEERGIAIGKECGRTLGREEAYMEMMRQLQELNVSKEIMEQLMKTKEIQKVRKNNSYF